MSQTQKGVGLVAATLMVAGNIMGSGVYLLPANLAATGGIAIFGWLVTIVGAISLSLVYAKFASFDESAGGPYAYTKRAFGNYLGYQTNIVYWLASWIGNIAMAVVGVGYLSYFLPVLKEPLPAALATIAMIWLFTFINILGPRITTTVQGYTTSLTFIPIFGVAIFGWFYFDPALYFGAWNVQDLSLPDAIQGTLNVTLWSFIGVETAAVVAGVVENPKRNVPIATISGVLIAAVAYVLSSTAIMGIIPNDALAKSAAPFSDAVQIAVGPVGATIVAFCAAAGCLGSLGGWTLVVGQTAKAASDDGLFPEIFGRQNKVGVPATGLVIVAVAMTVIVLLTISPTAAQQFGVISSVSVIFTLVPYIYSCAALRYSGEPHFGNAYAGWMGVIIVAILYSAWAIIGSSPQQVMWAFVIILFTTLFYAMNQVPHHPHHTGKGEE